MWIPFIETLPIVTLVETLSTGDPDQGSPFIETCSVRFPADWTRPAGDPSRSPFIKTTIINGLQIVLD